MAEVYSGEYQCSTYIVARARVVYSGNSATAYIQYKHTYGGYKGYSGSGEFGAGDAKSTWSWSNQYVGTSFADYMSIGFSISKSGGTYNVWCSGYSYNDFTVSVSFPNQYSAPSGVSGSNQTSDGTPQKAYSKISVSSWGNYDQTAADSNPYQWYQSDQSTRINASTSNTLYWTSTTASTNTASCAITGWYPRAKNNHSLYAWGSKVYIASPSAPTITVTGSASTSPVLTAIGSVLYKGGSNNSATDNSGTMKNWRLYYKKTIDSGYTQASSNNSSATTFTFDSLAKSTFSIGSNYNIQIKATNSIGGTGINTATVYCPTGISGTTQSKTTTSLTLKASANAAGTIGAASGGNMACYEIKWSTDKTTVDNGGGTSLGPQTSNIFNIVGLGNGQTIYYRVYGWNELGLSNVSNTIQETTIPRYDPVIGNISFSPKSPGADIIVPISHTGGLTQDELTVTSLTLEWKPFSSSTWSTLKTVTGLSITAGQSYTFTDAWTTIVASEGDYDFRVTASNGTDTSNKVIGLVAPLSVSLTNITQVSGHPNQLKATAVTTTQSPLYKYRFESQGGGVVRTKDFTTSQTTYTATTVNYLLLDTSYTLQATAFNVYGLWRKSNEGNATTPRRVDWYYCNTNNAKTISTMSYQTANGIKNVKDVYYIVKNALGNVTTSQSMNNKRLKFISQPLHYRPENVASITFSNGKKLAYALDSTSDTYKFGIWSGDTIQTTFFDGEEWTTSGYVFPNGYTVSSITSVQNKGLNSSAAFSTTICEDIPLWEQYIPTPPRILAASSTQTTSNYTSTYVKVLYYPDDPDNITLILCLNIYNNNWLSYAGGQYFAIDDGSGHSGGQQFFASQRIYGPVSDYPLCSIKIPNLYKNASHTYWVSNSYNDISSFPYYKYTWSGMNIPAVSGS